MSNGKTGRNDMAGMVPVVVDAEATASLEDALKRDPDHHAILARRDFLVALAMTSLACTGSCRSRGLKTQSAENDASAGGRDLPDDAKADTNDGSDRTDGNRIDGDQVADDANPGRRDAVADVLRDAKADTDGSPDIFDTREDANGSSCVCYSGGCGGCGCF
jgi:hypothetical protein